MHMYVYVYALCVCMCVCIYVCVCTMQVCIIIIYVWVYHLYACFVFLYVCMFVYIFMYVCMYLWTYVCFIMNVWIRYIDISSQPRLVVSQDVLINRGKFVSYEAYFALATCGCKIYHCCLSAPSSLIITADCRLWSVFIIAGCRL